MYKQYTGSCKFAGDAFTNFNIKKIIMCISKNILLVEDDADEQLFFTTALKDIDCKLKCTIASNGKEALERLRTSHPLPDIIFLDLEMPIMNGYTFLQELKLDALMKELPVIILTSLSDHYVAERTRKLGASAFLTKPSSLNMLQAKMHHLLNFDFSLNLKKSHKLFFTEFSGGIE
jgi:CheY-like chemotaxis protein